MSRRGLTTGLVVAGGAVGYYLYSAGGNPKLAEKKAEGMHIEYARYSAQEKLIGIQPMLLLPQTDSSLLSLALVRKLKRTLSSVPARLDRSWTKR
jgi:hypothetical protein